MQTKNYYVYIMTNKQNRVLYTGITNNLERRVFEHKNKWVPGFTAKYNLNKLVYFDLTDNVEDAITQEKRIKSGSRKKKLSLIQEKNPQWNDLSRKLWGDCFALRARNDNGGSLLLRGAITGVIARGFQPEADQPLAESPEAISNDIR